MAGVYTVACPAAAYSAGLGPKQELTYQQRSGWGTKDHWSSLNVNQPRASAVCVGMDYVQPNRAGERGVRTVITDNIVSLV